MKYWRYLLALLVIIVAILSARQLWYYPLFHRSPVLKINSALPIYLPSVKLNEENHTKIRYLLVKNDKEAQFPDNVKSGWSDWKEQHTISLDKDPSWITIFIQEKWALFRKSSSVMFFNTANEFGLFQSLMSCRFSLDQNQSTRHSRRDICFLGDSLSAGYFADSSANGYAAIVNRAVGTKDKPQVLGVIKIRLAEFNHQAIRDFIIPKVEVIVVELGTNDFKAISSEKFRNDYLSLMLLLRKLNPMAKIVCLGLWRGYSGYAYDKVIMDAAKQFNARYVYLGDLFEQSEMHSIAGLESEWGRRTDSFHPSSEGHKRIAERTITAIEQ